MTIAAVVSICLGVWVVFSFFMMNYDTIHSNGWSGLFLISSVLVIFFVVGSLQSDNVISVAKQPAEVIKTFDNIVVKAPDWPEQITKDFQVLEKPVQVVQTIMTNSWGHDKTYSYKIEFIPVEKE